MHSKGHHKRRKPSSRTTTTAVAILGAMLKIGLPLVLIAGIAAFVLNYRASGSGAVRVTTSVPGAEIFVGGRMTGLQSDTTLTGIPAGRCIVTVRKSGFVSEPEVVVADVIKGRLSQANFVLHDEKSQARVDSIPPLRHVRQEIFSTGEPVRSVPAVPFRRDRRLVDFSERERSPSSPVLRTEPIQQAEGTEAQSEPQAAVPIQNTQVTVSSAPEGAQIVVNGTLTSRVTPYTFNGLEEGMYIVRLLKPGFVVKPDSITVVLREDYQTELAAFELAPDASLPRPTLVIATTPPAAGIKLNGNSVGVGKVTVDAAFGKQTVEFAEVPGYRAPALVQVELTTEHPREEITGTYQKISGNAYLAVLPSEDLGTEFESEKLRVFVDNELLIDNPQQPFDVTLMGKILSGKRLVRVQYGELSDDIHVNLMDNEVAEVSFRIESFFSKRRIRLRDKSPIPLEKWEQKARRLTVLNAS